MREHSTGSVWCHGANLAGEGGLNTPAAHGQPLSCCGCRQGPGVTPALGTGGSELAWRLRCTASSQTRVNKAPFNYLIYESASFVQLKGVVNK